MNKTEKIILAYLAVGVAVRLSGRSVAQAINTETFVATTLLWPYALAAGYSGIPWRPPATAAASSDGSAVNQSVNA